MRWPKNIRKNGEGDLGWRYRCRDLERVTRNLTKRLHVQAFWKKLTLFNWWIKTMRKIDRINGKVHMWWLPQVGNFPQSKCWWNLMWLGWGTKQRKQWISLALQKWGWSKRKGGRVKGGSWKQRWATLKVSQIV
jgi:hypothetical protein